MADKPGTPQAGAFFGEWQARDLKRPDRALEALRELEKQTSILEKIHRAEGGFSDWAVNSLLLVGNLASDAVRQIEATKVKKPAARRSAKK
jgi:hypothetical protein